MPLTYKLLILKMTIMFRRIKQRYPPLLNIFLSAVSLHAQILAKRKYLRIMETTKQRKKIYVYF